MADSQLQHVSSDRAIEVIQTDLEKGRTSKRKRIAKKFLMAALGSIPWVGPLIAAGLEIKGDEAAVEGDDLRTQWLAEHQRKLNSLAQTIGTIEERFDSLGAAIDERVESEEYLALVRQAFRAWDDAETDQKRQFVANLLTNSAGTRVCSDDVVRLFISWIDQYHESHFAVIREIFDNPGSTRFEVWTNLYGNTPREDSAEADLFRLLIHDLSTGRVIRQARDVNEAGQFLRKRPVRRRSRAPTTLESAFEDSKEYVLSDLGRQFVHYTMNEAVTKLAAEAKE
jgi:hypothetical protein